MAYLLCNKKSFRTGRRLSKLLGLKYSNKPLGNAPAIRYGNSEGVYLSDTLINSPESIKLVSNSILFSEFCQEHEIVSPVYTPYNGQDDFPFLLRKKYHVSGKDIVVVSSQNDLRDINTRNLYRVNIFDTQYELRVHVINGECVKVFIKVNRDDIPIDIVPIRTATKGWRYILADINKYTDAQRISIEICEKIGIKFGAIDIAKLSKGYVCWEVNSAPGLNSLTLDVYAECLRKLI